MAQVADLLEPGDADHVPIGFCLDVGHECVPGAEGGERRSRTPGLSASEPSSIEVQLQQSDAQDDHHWPFTAERNRQGRIDAGRVLDTLAQAGASDVTLILEVIPGWQQPDDQVRADLVASVDYGRQAIADRGLAA